MSDGIELRKSWYNALDLVQSQFRQLLTSPASDWKRVPTPPSTGDGSNSSSPRPDSPQFQLKNKGKTRANSHTPDLSNVKLSRKSTKSGDVYRVQLDVTLSPEDSIPLDSWKSTLVTPEFRKEWDLTVESSTLIEMLDPTTRISKTNFTLGWPAYPRDAVTISRTFNDATTLIDISTSLPRSPDEPAYLRPSPPYVRSDVKLFAWCVQYSPQQPAEQSSRNPSRVRITYFWQHDFRAVWPFSSNFTTAQQLSAMVLGLYTTVKERGYRIPVLRGYGSGVMIERMRFEVDRVALTLNYSVVSDEGDPHFHAAEGIDELHTIREARRLTRAVECILPSFDGWDVQVSVKASSKEVEALPWLPNATRRSPPSPTPESGAPKPHDSIVFQIKHSPLLDEHSIMKVQITIEKSGSSPGALRLNGIPHKVETVEERDPSSYSPGMMIPNHITQDATSAAQISFQTTSTSSFAESSTGSIPSSVGGSSKTSPLDLVPGPVPPGPPPPGGPFGERSEATKKSILSRVKRNYIYFSSLLQEPEAKWKPTTEVRGVSVTQLDSIDPTLVVFRAEATFVGLGIWDLYSTIVTPGARAQWDRSYEDAVLLEDVNELSEVWHWKSKPIWPANGRDAVVLKTVYKSPTTIHVFAFSVDDLPLFPSIPPVTPPTIRTQVDLQGWSIEALSPTTTLVTLLEQSDPKGWSNKNSIPQQMITAVAGVGEFVIKCGGPPVMTRLDGASVGSVRYDHDRGSFRIEYSVCSSRRTTTTSTSTFTSSVTNIESKEQREEEDKDSTMPIVECELRCDLDTWGSALDIVVDPPPQALTCLRRHRLSAAGGGVWITITHDAVLAGDERLQAIVRRGITSSAKDKGLVMVNGVKVAVDVEDISEAEVKQLTKQKRVKPLRVPLDQPPVMRIKRRKQFDDTDGDSSGTESPVKPPDTASPLFAPLSAASVIPKFSSPLGRFFTMGSSISTQESPTSPSPPVSANEVSPSSSKPPMQHALDALLYVQQHHINPPLDGWTLVGDKGCTVHRRVFPEISPTIPIHKGEKVIEGVSAEEVASVIASYDCRKQWDTQFSSAQVFQVFRDGCHTAFVVNKGGFPFRDRGFYLASALARAKPTRTRARTREGEGENSNDSRTAIFCVSASFSPESVTSFSATKYNPYTLPIGRVFMDGWILETLDPYTTEKYTIPSTRCTRLVAVDYAGSMPTATNTSLNATLARGILAVETYVKGLAPSPLTRLPTYGLMLLDKASEGNVSGEGSSSWSLKKRDHNRLSVATKYDPQARVYRSTLLVTWSAMNSTPSSSSGFRPRASSPLWGSNDYESTPRPSLITPSLFKERDREDGEGPTSPQLSFAGEDLSSSTTSYATIRNRAGRVSSFSGRSRSRDATRSTSSVFTSRGEVRQPADLLVAEIVVDSRLYPGGYDINLGSRIRRNAGFITLPAPGQALGSEEKDKVLPLAATIHAMPSSPLHSSGLHEDRPPRHLLRLTLPTAPYHGSTLQDPLTGEIRTAPPKPQWLVNLQEKGGGVVDVEIVPADRESSSSVMVEGKKVEVVGEKEALTNLGREELLDNRASRSDILIRNSGDGTLSEEFQTPVAVAVHLLDPDVSATPLTPAESESKETEVREESPSKQDTGANMSPGTTSPETTTPQTRAGGLLGFLGSYQNPLSHFSTKASTPMNGSTTDLAGMAKKDAQPPGTYVDAAKVAHSLRAISAPRQEYPLRVVILIALIAFLLGSLLRSLLSPSDFIYVVTDVGSLEHVESGWREIRRLVEVKYLVGGWDFQIAVVRRH